LKIRGYRKDIDGLRALAVLPVILSHAGFAWIPGGFLGVDVFFVISGYLITNLLLRELTQTGTVKLSTFYLRRARRILPALFVVIAVTSVFAWFILLPEELARFGRSIIATSVFLSNVFFARGTDYFAPEATLSPLLHTWSLAVEEQFYLLFPLLLIFLWRRRKTWAMPAALVFIFVLSLTLAQFGHQLVGTSWTYYSLPTRAWELLAGSLAAVWVSCVGQPKPRLLLSVLGLGGLVSSYFIFNESVMHPGILTAIPVMSVLLLIMFTGSNSVIYRTLASAPLVFIGLISYSAYLWHQPIFALYRTNNFLPPTHFELWILVVLTLLLATASWRWVERPFRKQGAKDSSTKTPMFKFAAATAVTVLLGVGISNPAIASGRVSLSGVSFSEVSKKVESYYGLSKGCREISGDNPRCQSGENPTGLLWGDSYAMHLAGALIETEPLIDFSQSTVSACSPILGVSFSKDGVFSKTQKDCLRHNEITFNYLLDNSEIRTVILSTPWEALASPQKYLNSDGVVQTQEDIDYKLRRQLKALLDAGKDVILVGPPPRPNYIPSSCLIRQELKALELGACDFSIEQNENFKVEQVLLYYQDQATIILLSPVMCSTGKCITSKSGEYFYGFGGHLSPHGSKWIGQSGIFRDLLN
jgi:peptidoglycan/LPS O-acetylase OafA/YrhL